MTPEALKPTIPTREHSQTLVLDRLTTGIGKTKSWQSENTCDTAENTGHWLPIDMECTYLWHNAENTGHWLPIDMECTYLRHNAENTGHWLPIDMECTY